MVAFVGFQSHAQVPKSQPSIHRKPPESPLSDLYACQSIDLIAAKAACYDEVTKFLQAAERQGEIIALNAAEIRTIHEGIFGYKYLLPSRLELPDPEPKGATQTYGLQTITVPVKKVERYLSGYVITLDNDQVWEQFAGSISRIPKGKLSAEINTTPTGTYKMALFNTKVRVANVRVRRIQ